MEFVDGNEEKGQVKSWLFHTSGRILIQLRKRSLRSTVSTRPLTSGIVGNKAHVCGSPGIQATLAGRWAVIPDAKEPLRSSLPNQELTAMGPGQPSALCTPHGILVTHGYLSCNNILVT